MKRLGALTAKEIKVATRNNFFAIMVLLAGIYLAAVFWLLPGEIKFDPRIYYADQSGTGVLDRMLDDFTGSKEKLAGEDEVYQRLRQENYAWGMVAVPGEPIPQVELLFQGWEDERLKSLLVSTIRSELARNWLGAADTFQIREVGGKTVEWPPFNKFLVPLFMFSEVFMVGMFFIAALLFIERDEGTFKSFLVTPGRIWEYLLSKVLAMAVIAVLFTLLLVVPTLGAGPDYPRLLALVVLTSVFTSLLGVLAASYFKNLSQFIFPAALLLGVFSLPGISYMFPGFAPDFVRLLPTYDMIFGLRQAAFGLGEGTVFTRAAVMFLVLDAALLYLAGRRFSRQEVWG
ncbi:MAG: ABC transporter permease [Firmicutes bacterium]|nr:ABC transporter permease [Bacillota bacterium]